MSDVSMQQSLTVDPMAARAASMLRKLVGQPRVVVSHFVFTDGEGKDVKARPEDLVAVLEDFRSHSSEEPEVYLSRLAARLRAEFR